MTGNLSNEITLINADCLEEMKKMPENSIDTIITDPPYGIGFMGREWDTFRSDIVNAGVARSSRKIKVDNPESRAKGSAGFEAGRYDRSLQANKNFQKWFTVWGREALRVIKPGGTMLIFGGTRTYHRMACAIEDAGWILKDCIMWLYGSGFPKATDISKQLDKGHKRKVIGKKSYTTPKADNSIQANSYGISGGSLKAGQKAERLQENITEPTTPQAKLWNGWKSHGLKPAYEPILVAMKLNEGSYAENALKYGVSGLNIDGGRIGKEKLSYTSTFKRMIDKNIEQGYRPITMKGSGGEIVKTVTGRFPANIILDEEAAKMLDEQTGELKSGAMKKAYKYTNKGYSLGKPTGSTKQIHESNFGGASRFFYVAKASKAERNIGCGGLETKQTTGGGGMNDTPDNVCGKYGSIKSPGKNHHPTVKSLKLMEYLCRLTKTPTGGLVLDPFMGSGTTGMGCKITGRDFIGIDKEKEYLEIAKRRISATQRSMF